MIGSVFVLLLCGFAVSILPPPQVTNSQTTMQSPDQTESARLNAIIAELYKQGRYDEALPLAKRVLEIERAIGPERPDVAVALANLAELYFLKKKDGDAEKLFQEAAAIYGKNQISSPAVSNVLERLAQFSFLKRNYDNAIMLLERSLVIREQSYGAESSEVAETLHEIANVYQVDRKFPKADPFYLRAITIKEKLFGRTHAATVQAMKDYACLRVKNLPLSLGQEKSKTDLTESEKERDAIISRASCWLSGFERDCDKRPYEPRLNFSTVLNGKAIKLVQPAYPAEAKAKRLGGSVHIAVLIDEQGNVIKATPVCGGYSELIGAAVSAARASKFTPTKLDDRPVQVPGMIAYRFTMGR